ncbi:hypothetical protein RclHR1_02610021 [Rhizophagus clarus]|uniref:CigA protein n=1 Tax=Rhizophagus clarus TaxID=94130 RepID=A0A2Z6RCU5_9GLOM|nr:hypothetical protein RclHR1_02610021 [Rhizophagus clarus]GES81196.1 CigA protein [Rhizophagus clarus]
MISRGFFIISLIFAIIIFLTYKNNNKSLYFKNDPINEQEQSHLLNKDKEIVYIDIDSYNITEEEKFISYLPHSGFHNQRISVENAIFLAWYLNRTLILPPLMFFSGIPPFGMAPFDQLSQRLSQLKPNQNNFTECEKNQCVTANYTLYHWEELMSMKWIKQHVKIVHRTDFDDKNLLNILNTKEREVYYTKCNVRYHHRYYDYLNSTIGLDEFEERIDLAKLKDRKEKLFYFGSLYSTRRVVRELPENKEFWSKLLKEFVPENPIIIKIVNNIVKKIGGERNFLGVHARLGNDFKSDNLFRGTSDKTIESFILKISNDYREYENTFNIDKSTEVAKQMRQTILTSTKLIENKVFEQCSSKFTNNTLPIIIFLATDAKRTHKSLKPFLEKFPCVFMLEDFEDCKSLKSLENPLDKINMYKHLIPLVDLMISSKGSRFYGTPISTFSLYAMRLNSLSNTFDS